MTNDYRLFEWGVGVEGKNILLLGCGWVGLRYGRGLGQGWRYILPGLRARRLNANVEGDVE